MIASMSGGSFVPPRKNQATRPASPASTPATAQTRTRPYSHRVRQKASTWLRSVAGRTPSGLLSVRPAMESSASLPAAARNVDANFAANAVTSSLFTLD